MKILLAVDSSEDSQAALRAVAAQCHPQETQVRVLHVLQPITLAAAPQMSPMYTPELEDEGGEARKLVDRIASQLRSSGFKLKRSLPRATSGRQSWMPQRNGPPI